MGDGSTPVVLVTNNTLPANDWTTIHVMIAASTVSLKINTKDVYEVTLRNPLREMRLETPMFVGGVDDSIVLNNNTGVSGGFNGCIKDVTVYNQKVDIVNSSIQSANVQECSNYIPDRGDIPEEPSHCPQCRNGGSCPYGSSTCVCPPGFTGEYCESRAPPSLVARGRNSGYESDPCAARPCRNNGVCHVDRKSKTGYSCDCPLGFAGTSCHIPMVLYNEVGFNGNGYLELPSEKLRYDRLDEYPVVIALAFHTNQDGVLLYQREAVSAPNYGDYILLKIEQGHVVLEWNLGSGSSTLAIDDIAVNDGERHNVIVQINVDFSVWLNVDQSSHKTGMADGLSNLMNADSNIYIGGIPENYNVMRLPGLTGCIEQVELMDTGRNLNLGEDAIGGWNAQRCRE
ncbi:laminin G domain-containing protein [Phthorimaea operculella]|nr:laminin G domain-containing protein [Phthorimaea operculella]